MENNSLLDKLGRIKSNISIYYKNSRININEISFIKRNVTNSRAKSFEGGYGFAYESYHLEFISNTIIENGTNNFFNFYNEKNELIWKLNFYPYFNPFSNPNNTIHAYSIDLNNVPFILFDNITKIEIDK